MELKKNPTIDPNNYRNVFFMIGLIASLGIVITAMEWRFTDNLETMELSFDDERMFNTEQVDVPVTSQPPPPPPKTVLEQPEIVEVEDDEIVDDMEINLDAEFDDDTKPQTSIFGSDDGAAPSVAAPPPPPEEKEDEIFMIVEQQPEPEGGITTFYQYVADNLKYPREAQRMDVEGRVYVQFVVNKDGALTDIEVLRGIGYGCDEEAVRVLKNAPKWKPGKQRGKAVRVKMSLPIRFALKHLD